MWVVRQPPNHLPSKQLKTYLRELLLRLGAASATTEKNQVWSCEMKRWRRFEGDILKLFGWFEQGSEQAQN